MEGRTFDRSERGDAEDLKGPQVSRWRGEKGRWLLFFLSSAREGEGRGGEGGVEGVSIGVAQRYFSGVDMGLIAWGDGREGERGRGSVCQQTFDS